MALSRGVLGGTGYGCGGVTWPWARPNPLGKFVLIMS